MEAIYYDIKGNVIQTRSNNHLGGYDYKYFNYNFANQQTSQFYRHIFTDAFMTMSGPVTWLDDNYQYEYDHTGRLLKTKLNGAVIEENNYNEIGLFLRH